MCTILIPTYLIVYCYDVYYSALPTIYYHEIIHLLIYSYYYAVYYQVVVDEQMLIIQEQ